MRLPIFPLHSVLFPGGRLPLKIFEPRYVAMTTACLRDNTPFGVCRIREGQEVGTPATYDAVGCAALIGEWEVPHANMFHLQAHGTAVFRASESSVNPLGLIEAQIEWLPETRGHLDERTVELCVRMLQSLEERLGPTFLPPPHAFDDARWVSYRLAELLPLALSERQKLLEERDDGRRFALLLAAIRALE
jgi:Lon protease-like protein